MTVPAADPAQTPAPATPAAQPIASATIPAAALGVATNMPPANPLIGTLPAGTMITTNGVQGTDRVDPAATSAAQQPPAPAPAEPNPWSILGDQKPEDVKAALDAWKAHQDSQKTEQQRQEEARAEAARRESELTSRASASERENARLRAAITAGVPADYLDLVVGDSPEAIAASVQRVATLAQKAAAYDASVAAAQQQAQAPQQPVYTPPIPGVVTAAPGAAPIPVTQLRDDSFPAHWVQAPQAMPTPTIG